MTPTRKRRLIAVGLVLVAVGIAAALTVMALSQNMTYLFSPSEVLSGHAPPGSAFRLGGVVLENSLHRDSSSLKVGFTVTDRFHDMPVEYAASFRPVPRVDIVATGRMDGSHFIAREVLAKHDKTTCRGSRRCDR
jgi:cytochrome c-type biogenesis protein CcmE